MLKVSIIMPVYNGSPFLENSIGSVSKQTLKDIELICVDDGSTDDSLELLTKLSEKYDFIRIISQENQGSGAARNNGIKNAKGEYVAFLDADDEFLDANALESMYAASSINNADMITANLQMIDEEGNQVDNFFYSNRDYLFVSRNDVIAPDKYGLPLSFYKSIFKRTFLINKDIYFPDLRRGQDPPFLAKVITSTSEIPTVPVNFYGHHFKSGGGAESKVNTYEKQYDYVSHFKLTFEILEKKGYFDLVDRYKKKLFIYLENNLDDNYLNGFNIVSDIFGYDDTFFEGFENKIMEYRIKQLINHLDVSNDEFFFNRAKRMLLSYDIWNNDLLSMQLLKKCFLVFSYDTLDDYRKNNAILENYLLDMDLPINEELDEKYDNNLGDFTKYITARIDLKNFGLPTNDIKIIENSDFSAKIAKPAWFKNNLGIGTQIESKKGLIHLKIRCINDGKLKIYLRGIDYKDKKDDRIPIYINYEYLKVNDEIIFNEPTSLWHNEPFLHEKEVNDGEIIDITVQWNKI